jgi:hypothetical protein
MKYVFEGNIYDSDNKTDMKLYDTHRKQHYIKEALKIVSIILLAAILYKTVTNKFNITKKDDNKK